MNSQYKEQYVENVFYKLGQTARVSELMARNYYKEYVKGAGFMLEPDEFKILAHIIEQPDMSQGDLSRILYKGKAHIGKILNEMESKNYIKRAVSSKNNVMIKHTTITDYGMELFVKSDIQFRQIAISVLDSFEDSEINELKRLLDKLKNNMLEKNKLYF